MPFAVILAAGMLLLCFAALFGRLARRRLPLPNCIDWLDEFSLERYRPMERLLDENDFHFISQQPGYSPSIGRTLRAERRAIFRAYLRDLSYDFSRLMDLARFMIVYADRDRTDLANALWRMQFAFYMTLAMVHIRLTLHVLGIGGVPVSELVTAVTRMRDQVYGLAPAAHAA